MKTLLIMRHAKSSWNDASLKDIDRPLNARGKKDAPNMGQFLKSQQLFPEKVYCSPARRTRSTLKKMMSGVGLELPAAFPDALYYGGTEAYLSAVASTSSEVDTVMTLGHNPMTEDFIDMLAEAPVHKPVKTACIACLQADIAHWMDLEARSCRLLWLKGPKDI